MKIFKQCLKYISLFPPIIIMIIIFYFSAQPAKQSSELSGNFAKYITFFVEKITNNKLSEQKREKLVEILQFPVRKGAHMSEFALLGITILIPIYLWKSEWTHKKMLLISILLTICYASTDEFHQLFVSGRAGRITDILIDGIGATIGIMLVYFIIIKKTQNFT